MPKLSVNLVIYNDAKYIPYLFDSLKRQTFKDWELIFVDNACTDGTPEAVRHALEGSGISYRIITNPSNLGFSVGHNIAYRYTQTPYFLLLNADMYLQEDVFEKMVAFLDAHPDTAAVAPRLMRWDFERVLASVGKGDDIRTASEAGFTNQIDALGIRLFRNRRGVEWLTAHVWSENSDDAAVREIFSSSVKEVFGVSGAFPMYRKKVIDAILLPGANFFDPTYHSYKEDVDLSYRLRNAGYTSYVLLNTASYHNRTAAGPKAMSDFAALKNKTKQSYFVRYNSYKNHIRTLIKNEYWQNVVLDFPYIMMYEIKKLVLLLMTMPKVPIAGWWAIFRDMPYTLKARRSIVQGRKMYWKGIRRWFFTE